ncbi:MAG: cytidine deaminase [Bacteroidetes bacterium]|nr:cytidine deaminase [Bacteroidota bacterium]
MKKELYQFEFHRVSDRTELSTKDIALLNAATQAAQEAYAPYSNFKVGAAAYLANGKLILGSNQENASYPVGICAERVLLGNAAVQYPGVAIDSLAITYLRANQQSSEPISPCGMCRQALSEYESRVNQPIRLLLAGITGDVLIFDHVHGLLPFVFQSQHLSKK